MMRRSPWLAIAASILLIPVLSAAQESSMDKRPHKVPEGGSPASYLLVAAVACVGGMFIRSLASRRRSI